MTQVSGKQTPVNSGERYRVAMMAILRYGSGLPLYRLGGLQANLGIPLPASTQWEVVAAKVEIFEPVHRVLIYEAAQGRRVTIPYLMVG